MTSGVDISGMVDIPVRFARETPSKVALIFEERTTTYADLERRMHQIANGLDALGFRAGDRVAVLATNSDHVIELLFGIARARGVACPLNWRLAPAELLLAAQDAEATILFVQKRFLLGAQSLREQLPMLRHVIVMSEDDRDDYVAWRDRQSDAPVAAQCRPDDIIFQLYTSGTTGVPKGVMHSDRGLAQGRWLEKTGSAEWASWSERDVTIIGAPLFHVSGAMWTLQFLSRGGTCVVHAQVDPAAMLAAVEKFRVTRLFAVPSVLRTLVDRAVASAGDYSSLKTIAYGGSPIAPPLLRAAFDVFGCGFIQMYGTTETGTIGRLEPEDHDPARPERLISCGRPLPGIRLKVVGEDGAAVPSGATGELWISTPALMDGYWKQPEATAEALSDGWYRTGDAGYVDSENYIYLVDRLKDMIVSGGENIYPAEVERVLLDHPAITDVAIIGIPDTRWGEALKAIIVVKGEAPLAEELITFLRPLIAGYKIPRSFDFVDALPVNASGKILRRELRQRYWGTEARRIA